MFLTQEDYRKIELWLKERTIKDTEFPDAKPLTGDEKVVVVQEEANRLTNIDTIFRTVPQSLINITDRTGLEFSSIENAIAAVPEEYRKMGALITFNLQDKGWQIAQFIGKNINEWLNVNKWDNLTESLQNSLKNISTRLSELEAKTEDNRENIDSNFQQLNRIIGEDGKINSSVLPSYVDDIVDVYASYTKSDTGELSNIVLYSDAAKTKLITGESSKIYQNIAEGEPPYQFRWSGTQFAQTGANSLVIGDVTGTAFDGGKGAVVRLKTNSLPNTIISNISLPSSYFDNNNSNIEITINSFSNKGIYGTYVEEANSYITIPDAGIFASIDQCWQGLMPRYVSVSWNHFVKWANRSCDKGNLINSKLNITNDAISLSNSYVKLMLIDSDPEPTPWLDAVVTEIPLATSTSVGLMSKEDKTNVDKINSIDTNVNNILHKSGTKKAVNKSPVPIEFEHSDDYTKLILQANIYDGEGEPQENSYSMVTEQGLRNYLSGDTNGTFSTAVYNTLFKPIETNTGQPFAIDTEPSGGAIPAINYHVTNHGANGVGITLGYYVYNGDRDLNPTANNLVTEGGLNSFLTSGTSRIISTAIENNLATRIKYNLNPITPVPFPVHSSYEVDESTGFLNNNLEFSVYPGATVGFAGESARDLDINSLSFIGEGTLKDYLNSNYALATEEKQGLITPQEKAEIAKVADKADISDLSNVLAEEVIDEPLLSEINTLTREEIKKDLFIDMWNQACGSYGRYNAETDYFELNGLTDITYEQALEIYNYTAPSGNSQDSFCRKYVSAKIRTTIPINFKSVQGSNISNMFEDSLVEVVRFTDMKNNIQSAAVINPTKAGGTFFNCHNLREVIGGIYTIYADLRYWTNMFIGCENLREVRMSITDSARRYDYNLSFKDSPLLSYNSLHHIVSNTRVNDTSKPITITVHPDVYAKLTDTYNIVKDSDKFNKPSHSSSVPVNSIINVDGTMSITTDGETNSWFTKWWTDNFNPTEIENAFSEGDPFTISFTVKSEDGNGLPQIFIKSSMVNYPSLVGNISSQWSTIYYCGTWHKASSLNLHLQFKNCPGTYTFKNWKIEKGHNTNPIWTPYVDISKENITEWNKVLTDAAAKQITFVTA